MKLMPLSQGQFAKVDDEDFARLGHYKWRADWAPNIRGYYARRYSPSAKKNVSMHREILGLTDPSVHGDHINHDTLDNQRANLRAVNWSQNSLNRKGPNRGSESGHRGVTWHKASNRWLARIAIRNKQIYLGIFKNKEDAAAAYVAANTKLAGEFGGQYKTRVHPK